MWSYLKNFNFIMCFLLLVVSGNPIFIYSSIVRNLYIILAVLSIIFTLYKQSDGIRVFIINGAFFLIMAVVQHAFIDGLSFSSQMFSILRILIGILLVRLIGDKFVNEYVKVMTIVAFISIIGFVVNVVYGFIPGGYQMSKIGYSLFLYNQLYSDFSGIVLRNCGMFWEPGAFQGYLNIAIAFALLLPKNKARNNSLMILIVALLTTFSTTGYTVFAFIAIYYVYKFSELSIKKRVFCLILVCFCCIYAFFTLDFMNDKITENLSDVESAQGRITDFIRYGDILKDNFLLGVNTETDDNIFSTGNGFVFMILYYGGIVVVYYFLLLFYNLKSRISKSFAVYFSIVVLLTLQGEGFMFYPLYLALPFILYRFDLLLIYKKRQ